jgi:hypothetical protein
MFLDNPQENPKESEVGAGDGNRPALPNCPDHFLPDELLKAVLTSRGEFSILQTDESARKLISARTQAAIIG